MIARSLTVLAWAFSFLAHEAATAPTWPSSVDELEDIMFLNTGYQARRFAQPITPCTSAGAEGFMSAAQWLRMAFHDMGTANVFTGVGGLDASIIYEMGFGTNGSPGFNATLLQLAPFFSSRSSMADLIAMSVYTAVRGCGGPVVPIRTGRIDATGQGPNPDVFLPQPQNSPFTFQSQFQRMGFDTSQMIAVVACGHTLGQVHSITFPQIAKAGPRDLDSTPAVFDQHVASDYLAGTTPDLLVIGPSGFASDKKVFGVDGNVTITSMATAAGFNNKCSTALQQLIEVVPSGTVLTDPIMPYDVKPSALQLTLQDGGLALSFTGQIRVRTTGFSANQIAAVQLVFVDRTGGNQCGSGGCIISTSPSGSSAGFDDSFVFYAFSSQIPSSTSISAFNVIITFAGGATAVYNNNGAGFPVQDTIMLQTPESCLSPSGGMQNLTIVAAVRNTIASPAVTLTLTKKVPVSGLNVPALQTTSLTMASQSTIGPYTLFAASSILNIYQLASPNIKFDVSVGTGANQIADSFKNSNRLPGTCGTLSPNSSTSTSTSSSVSTSSTITSSASATASAPAGWKALGCYSDNVGGGRTLRNGEAVPGGATAMTVELCVAACQAAGFVLAGMEYSQECWCDNTLNYGGGPAPDGSTGCSMPCKGDSSELCGGPNRLNMYISTGGTTTSSASTSPSSTTISASATSSVSTSTSASATASAPAGWTALGCYSDNVGGGRTLQYGEAVPGGATAMTIELCVAACQAAGFVLAGVEYSQECWCDNTLNFGGGPASDGSAGCNMLCKGDTSETCGGPNRLNMYRLASSTSSSPSTSTTTFSTITATTSSTITSSIITSSTDSSSATTFSITTSSVASSMSTSSTPTSSTDSSSMTTSSIITSSVGSSTATSSATTSSVITSSPDPSSTTASSTITSSTDSSSMTTSATTSSADSSTTTSSIITSPTTSSESSSTMLSTPSSTTSSTTSSMTTSLINNLSTSITSSTTSTTATTSASATASAPAGWMALGCYSDGVNGGRTLRNGRDVPGGSSAMTVELCVAACKSSGFLLAGVEYGGECYCDNTFNSGGGPAPDGNVGCNMPCNGDSSETCGGSYRLNIYQNSAYQPVGNPKIPGYTYQGCYNEPPNARALTGSSTASDSMTVESCASFCTGATYFGVEYGRECYCGASLPSASTVQPAGDCSFTCAGNNLEYCGAGNRLDVYKMCSQIDGC